MSEVHVIYDGRTDDVNLEVLIPPEDRAALGIDDGIELKAGDLTADQIKKALVNHYDKPAEEFEELVVEFHKTGNITVRPNAIFGV